MSDRWTPGKWRVRQISETRWFVETELASINGLRCWYPISDFEFDAAVNGYSEGAVNPEADAHICSAAPDMAEALDAILSAGYVQDVEAAKRAIALCRAALAKARGQA